MTINPAGPGPQRLLALDGGGIRGIISIEVLGRIESMVREARADDRAVLADYFHYIAGTSTGAIIAACLSVGMPVATIREFYRSSAREMFVKANVLKRWVLYKYNADRLSRRLREVFGEDTTFGDPKLRTLLMLVLRNATTDSPWTVSNNPAAKYNGRRSRGHQPAAAVVAACPGQYRSAAVLPGGGGFARDPRVPVR